MWALNKKVVSLKYVSIIKNMYDGVVTNVKTCDGLTDEFSIIIRGPKIDFEFFSLFHSNEWNNKRHFR